MSDKHASSSLPPLYGVSAEFASPDAVLVAAHALRKLKLGKLDILSPVPIAGAIEAIGVAPRAIPQAMAVGACALGFAAMMGMCIYATAYDYVFDIGGRPLISWQAFMVPSVSFATLLGAAVVFFNMTFLNRLPLLNHPAFNIPGIGRVTQDRFFLTIEPVRDGFDVGAVERALSRLSPKPLAVHRVPR